jgi:signal transduction histidine kinase
MNGVLSNACRPKLAVAANSAPGVGLGLALSRRLARDMGGDLVLIARPDDGACFALSLPQG